MPYDSSTPAQGPFYQARFSDGTSAAARDVRVAMSPRGLILRPLNIGDGEDLIWPYGALTTAEPLSAHAIDAQVSYTYQPGASLFVPNGSFARELAKAAPHLTTRAARRRAAMPWIWVAVAIATIATLVSLSNLSPARAIAGLMPDGLRNSLGKQTIASITRDKNVCKSPDGLGAVATLANRLQAKAADHPVEIVVVDWSLVNAFATPGNQIVLTSGLIKEAKNSDEVAGVLAHEIGHARLLHPETSMVRVIGMSAAVELMLGGGSGTLANIGVLLTQLSYTRQAEEEADEEALVMLRQAGISADNLANFFRRVQKVEGKADGDDDDAGEGSSGGGLLDMLSTHPRTEDRVRRIETANRYPATEALTASQWQALKSICDNDNE